MTSRRTTVLIPLHRAAPWREKVRDTALTLSSVATVMVSDADGADDTLTRLGSDLDGLPGIELLGPRDLAPGWVAHANDLQARARTPYVMWMPQDDSVDAAWVLKGERVLDARPEAVLAVGTMHLINGGRKVTELAPITEYAAAEAVDRVRSALRRQFFTGPPGLGHAYRGVQRASATVPLPVVAIDGIEPTIGWKADVLWAMTMLARGPFASIDAVYRKTMHRKSASHDWAAENLTPGFRQLLTESLRELAAEDRLALVAELWDEEGSRLRRRVRLLEKRERARRDSNSQPSDP